MSKKVNIGVIGGGAWGTTIAKLLSEKNSNVLLWAKETHVKKNIEKYTAYLINQGFLIGWFQGRMEFGHRALGNRSILADPRKAYIKDKVKDLRSNLIKLQRSILKKFQF